MPRLNDPTCTRTWKYTAAKPGGRRSGPFVINENLTGAVLGDQRAARITFRMALWILHGWNRIGEVKFHLVIPNPVAFPVQSPEY